MMKHTIESRRRAALRADLAALQARYDRLAEACVKFQNTRTVDAMQNKEKRDFYKAVKVALAGEGKRDE